MLSDLVRGCAQILSEEELRKKLGENRPLRVKLGVDPTAPDIHLGHTVGLTKLRQFQELGHQAILIIGDFTAMIGDPSGRSATRPQLTHDEVMANAKTYQDQAFKILDPEKTRVVFNGEWFEMMTFEEVIRLNSRVTLQQMLQREDFRERMDQGHPVRAHEIQYPIMQGWDSVMIQADVELGGTDQLFNLMVGRDLMREYGLRPQCVLTTPILEGLNARLEDGVIVGDKMSKSLDNYVGLAEPPEEQLGKLMSISDDLMWRYYELLSELTRAEIEELKADVAEGRAHPKAAKMGLAKELVRRFHGAEAADEAERKWEAQFSRREIPEDMPELTFESGGEGVLLAKALADASLVPSSSEGRRRIKAGAVEIDGEKVRDEKAWLAVGGPYVVKAGKRAWARIVVR